MTKDNGYSAFLNRNSITDDDVQELMARLPKPVPNTLVDAAFELAPSGIHGLGLFTKRVIRPCEVFPVTIGPDRLSLARYTNHSDTPNSSGTLDDLGDVWCVVNSHIAKGEEITMDYNHNKSLSEGLAKR